MNLDEEGHVRGAAFIEFEEEVCSSNSLPPPFRLAFTIELTVRSLILVLAVGCEGRVVDEQSRIQEATNRGHRSRPEGEGAEQVSLTRTVSCPSLFDIVTDSEYRWSCRFALDRCVRVGGLPAGLQEALLQQAFEKVSPVSRVSVIEKFNEAIVELESEDVRSCHHYDPSPSRR